MKRIAQIVALLFFTFSAFAQAPQAICYQAVATDQTGHELISQNVKVRLSILKGATSGPEEWIETHAVTTDGFGLFDLQIGNGSRTGGAQISLSNIRWGSDKYFLKVEMDITGGNNYSLMGTNQLVSVPYALYSEKSFSATFADSSAKAGRASTADFAATAGLATRATFADSAVAARTATTATTATRAIFADSANSARTATTAITATRAIFADSAIGARAATTATTAVTATTAITAITAITANRAIVADSALAVSRNAVVLKALFADSATAAHRAVNALNSVRALSAARADSASFAWNADSSRRAGQAQKALLSDSTLRAQTAWLAYNANKSILADSSKKAGFASRADTATAALTAVNDFDRDPTNELQTLTFRNDSLILSNPTSPTAASVVSFKNEIFRAPGASIEYPVGILGEALTITTNFTVPMGKTLYVSAVNNGVRLADGRLLYAEPGMPIIPEGNRIASCYCSGILLSNQPDITPILLDFTSPLYEYTVPFGFTLVIKSGKTDRGLLDLQIDADTYSFYTVTSQSPRLITITSGKKVKKPISLLPSDTLYLTGYLLKNRS